MTRFESALLTDYSFTFLARLRADGREIGVKRLRAFYPEGVPDVAEARVENGKTAKVEVGPYRQRVKRWVDLYKKR